jgi:rhodanese-related sulfurtransferase
VKIGPAAAGSLHLEATMALKQFLLLGILSAVLGLGVNLFSPNKIPYVGEYRELSRGDGPIIPPTAEPGDPPFMAISEAHLEHQQGTAIFVDARSEEEFLCGTIPGSVLIPFEYMPDGDLSVYFDSALAGAPKDQRIITYCSGEECDLSLHLARNLLDFGYTDVYIFFGGSREWENAGLEIERRQDCGD